MHKKILVSAAVIACAAPLATVAIADRGESPARGRLPVAGDQVERERALSRFQVLNDVSRAEADASVTEQHQGDIRPGERLDPSKTRVLASDTDVKVLLMASDASLCLVIQKKGSAGGSSTCTDVGTAASGKVLTSAAGGTGDRWEVDSIVPDGVTAISITTASGDSQSIDAKHNGLHAVLGEKPVTMSWTNSDGSSGEMAFRGLED